MSPPTEIDFHVTPVLGMVSRLCGILASIDWSRARTSLGTSSNGFANVMEGASAAGGRQVSRSQVKCVPVYGFVM